MEAWLILVAIVLLSVERGPYVWIARHPDAFRRLCATRAVAWIGTPVIIVGALFGACKVVQISVFLAWWYVHQAVTSPLGRGGARWGRDVWSSSDRRSTSACLTGWGPSGCSSGTDSATRCRGVGRFPSPGSPIPRCRHGPDHLGALPCGTVSASGLVRAPRGGDRFLRGERASRKPSGGHGRRGSRHSAARPGVVGPTAGSQHVDPGAGRDPAAWRVSACRRGPLNRDRTVTDRLLCCQTSTLGPGPLTPRSERDGRRAPSP